MNGIRRFLNWRVVLAVIFAIAACAGLSSEVLDWLNGFSGEIYVGTDQAEQVLIRETVPVHAWDAWSGMTILRNLSPGEIPFMNSSESAKLLNSLKTYDAFTLPFALQLKRVNVMTEEEPLNQLKIRAPEGERTVEFQPNQDLQFGDAKTKWHVDSVRKWSGLLAESQGEPMVLLSLRKPTDPQWTEGITLPSNTWQRVEPNIGIHFEWFDNEDAARQLTRLEAASPARWGLIDGKTVTWLENFGPGMGGTLHDKTSITLLQRDEQPDPPVITVRIDDRSGTRDVKVSANVPTSDIPVVYEDFGCLDTVLLLSAWKDGQAFAVAYQHRQPCGENVLECDTPWMPRGLPYQVRVDQVMQHAVRLSQHNSNISEVVLLSPERTLRIRQGQAEREGDLLIEFLRKSKPSALTYEFAIKGGGKDASLIVKPDDAIHFRRCVFSQGSPGPDPLHAAALRVEVHPEHPWRRVVLALSLVALVLLIVWRMSHHGVDSEGSTTSDDMPV